jgi:imidazolonepropionase-like amidohydrolase
MPANLTSVPARLDVAAIEQMASISRSRRVWLQVGQLFDGESVHRNEANIVFDATQIYAVTTDGRQPDLAALPPDVHAPDVVLPHCTLIPCLVEAHAHLSLEGGPVDTETRRRQLALPPPVLQQHARERIRSLWKHGVGTVRDAGDKDGVGLALATEARSRLGQVSDMPWIDSPGAALYHRGRYGSFMGIPVEDHDTLDHCVADRVSAGADRIKLLVSGIINFAAGGMTTSPQMSALEVTAIVAAAKQRARQTFAHASGVDGVENSIVGGVNTVEHGFFVTEEQLTRMRDSSIAWVPTFAPVQAQVDHADEIGWTPAVVDNLERILDGHRQALSRAYELGVAVLAGSDAGSCGVPHGIGLLRELCYMEEAGVPTLAVLRAATGASAETLAFAEPVGRIASGCRSRFILTRHDPTRSVAKLQEDKVVVFDGHAVASDGESDEIGL